MEATALPAVASSGLRGVHPRGALRALFSDLDERGIHATPRAVAVAIWSHANVNGGCWPSQRRLARMTGRCERTVRSAVKALEAAGVILRRVPDLRMRRVRRATTVYRLLVGDAPPLGAQRAEPPAVLVDAAARVAALVGRDIVVPDEMPDGPICLIQTDAPEAADIVVPVDLVADPEPPSVEFLPPEAVDLVGIEMTDATPEAVELADDQVPVEAVELVDAAPEEPPLVVPVEREEPPAITGSRCRISEPTNTLTAEQRARPIDDAADLVVPVGRPRGAPRRLQRPTPPPPRGGPVRALVVPVAASTRAAPSAPAAEPPTRPTATTPPPALAAAAARCAALARRR